MDAEETATLTALLRGLDNLTAGYDLMDAYYRGQQRLEQLGLAVPPELRKFLVIVGWPQLAVDAVEERMDVEGFRYPGSDVLDDELARVFQANNLAEESQLCHLDALIFGRSYLAIGSNEDDTETPLITVESPREVYAAINKRTRRVEAAVRRTYATEIDGTITTTPDAATLYLPDVTVWLDYEDGQWNEIDRDPHGMGVVPVVPVRNRPRIGDPFGTSEMAPVVPITDAACRALTNLQVAQETHAVPQRGVLGATKGDFVDAAGNQLPAWQAYFGAVWAMANENAKTFQFDPSDLSNFETVINLYGRLVSSLTGLPPHYLGFTTDNPASADAIRSSEARLVKRCERKQRPLGGSWEEAMRIVRRIQTGEEDVDARRLETVWRDPSTPTVAQRADAAVKLYAAGIVPRRQTREDLGYTAEQIKRMEDQDIAANPELATANAKIDLAKHLDAEGLPSSPALAAAGLFVAANQQTNGQNSGG